MQFNRHFNLEGQHAPFSPSQSSWLRYDDDKTLEYYSNKKAAEKGTRLHEWAKETILLGIRQPDSKQTLYSYINDAIGFDMKPEVVLYYSDNFFGTADSISFRKNPETGKNILRIHDLKTGKTPVHIEQLEIYAAIFCLEYGVKPRDIDIELRIYQNDEVWFHNPKPEDIIHIMNRIVHLDNLIKEA